MQTDDMKFTLETAIIRAFDQIRKSNNCKHTVYIYTQRFTTSTFKRSLTQFQNQPFQHYCYLGW